MEQAHIPWSEKQKLQDDITHRLIHSIKGPIGFYERAQNGKSELTIPEESREVWRPFCKLLSDEGWKDKCDNNHIERVAACTESNVTPCWVGIHNVICPVENMNELNSITLIGGVFHLKEEMELANTRFQNFLETEKVSEKTKAQLTEFWNDIPTIDRDTIKNRTLYEFESAAHTYLSMLQLLNNIQTDVENVRHDFAILLQALIASIEILQIDLTETFNIGRKWIERFNDLLNTCEQYDTYLRVRLGSLGAPKFTYEPLAQVLYSCIDQYRAQARQRGIEFRIELQKVQYEEDEQIRVPHLKMAKYHLIRAIHNALDNAVKYSFKGTADHPRWIDIKGWVSRKDGRIGYAIDISNLGIGIESDELDLVFKSGYQGRRRLGEFRPGYGIGLTFIQECIEMHQGTVSIESFPSSGTGWLTTLHIWLPIEGPKT